MNPKNNFTYNYANSGVSEDEISKTSEYLKSYISYLKEMRINNDFLVPEASINLAFDEANFEYIKISLQKLDRSKLKYIFLVGIGGSNLGTQAIYNALFGNLDLLNNRRPKIIFLDTISANLVEEVENLVSNLQNKEEFVVNLTSKSGSTTETIGLFEVLNRALKNKFGEIYDRIITITDKDSNLWRISETKNYLTFEIPKAVGGRFSVFSSVGIIPLFLCGINVEQVLEGAKDSVSDFIESEQDNLVIKSASISYLNFQKNVKISNFFLFNPDLEGFGKWLRQLISESLGKDGNGITPIVSVGTTDLHSQLQLYLAGPKDKFTTFINGQTAIATKIDTTELAQELVPEIHDKNLMDVLSAIFKATMNSYVNKVLPFTEVNLQIDEYNLGYLMQFKMIETMLLGKLMNINAFDQPEVEGYKKEVNKILAN